MKKVIVVGAGAAGSMAAIFAASSGAETLLLERTRDGGRKILISGGGRCNVLPIDMDETRFVTDSSPNLLRKMLRSWPLHEQVAFFENDLGIPLVEEQELGKRFPASHKARDVRDGLLSHASAKGVTIAYDTTVSDFGPTTGGWRVDLENGEPILADSVIIASGGLSVPNTGSDGTGLRVLEKLGHKMNPTYAALTPLTSNDAEFGSLSGVSFPLTLSARAPARSSSASGGFLFTHHGYSGPSVLNVSHVAVRSSMEGGPPARISVKWTALGEKEWENALKPQGLRTVLGALRAELPDRLVSVLLAKIDVNPERILSELRRDERLRLIEMLVRGELPWTGDEGYRKAEVTGGGVELGEVNPRTMESKRHPGLFICGEVLDAFGPIGGYNFAWAWATGRAAGIGAAG
ncbi:MAG TPA: aminoacetone oxidase family FAD-binding enzyme [Gemmatimonadaceae bacterium]|nr:aminoacetone oxidase family FAD-binding enzyme [Gemmatimonadaceae bacterium]